MDAIERVDCRFLDDDWWVGQSTILRFRNTFGGGMLVIMRAPKLLAICLPNMGEQANRWKN